MELTLARILQQTSRAEFVAIGWRTHTGTRQRIQLPPWGLSQRNRGEWSASRLFLYDRHVSVVFSRQQATIIATDNHVSPPTSLFRIFRLSLQAHGHTAPLGLRCAIIQSGRQSLVFWTSTTQFPFRMQICHPKIN